MTGPIAEPVELRQSCKVKPRQTGGSRTGLHLTAWAGWLGLFVLVPDALAQGPAGPPVSTNPIPARASQAPPWWRDPERVHDPSSIVTVDGVRRCFCTGPGISVIREDPAGRWLREGRVFPEQKFPAWHDQLVPGNRGYLWAPDIGEVSGRYLLYYSVSTLGKNTSAIGLAVGRGLDPSSPEWSWEDRGVVIASSVTNRFNAIDPALFRDATDGSLWLAFGSFWDGIHLVELDPATGLRRDPGAAPVRLARAPEIEAPFLHQRGVTIISSSTGGNAVAAWPARTRFASGGAAR